MPEVKVAVVIPARYAARRLPGKPLAAICGRPMIQWVVEGCRSSTRATRTIVATDNERIRDACENFGAAAILTATNHRTGNDRVVTSLQHIGLRA